MKAYVEKSGYRTLMIKANVSEYRPHGKSKRDGVFTHFFATSHVYVSGAL